MGTLEPRLGSHWGKLRPRVASPWLIFTYTSGLIAIACGYTLSLHSLCRTSTYTTILLLLHTGSFWILYYSIYVPASHGTFLASYSAKGTFITCQSTSCLIGNLSKKSIFSNYLELLPLQMV